MNKDNSLYSIFSIFILSLIFFVSVTSNTYSATDGTNVVINQVQIAGSTANDEFVELYNPTNSDIDLTGWRLVRYSSTGTISNLDSSLEGIIPAMGYYLLGHSEYDGNVSLDENYSTQNNISSNGAVGLFSDAGITIVDTLGFGTGLVFEAQSVDNPPANTSVIRTNGIDTDNNFNDFSATELADPHNSATSSATPSPTPTPSPTATPSPTPSTSPSVEPTASASATPTPSPSPSQTPTSEPTVTPTPTPSPSQSATASPTATPTDRPVRTVFLASFSNRDCRLEYRYMRFGFMRVAFPRIICS